MSTFYHISIEINFFIRNYAGIQCHENAIVIFEQQVTRRHKQGGFFYIREAINDPEYKRKYKEEFILTRCSR